MDTAVKERPLQALPNAVDAKEKPKGRKRFLALGVVVLLVLLGLGAWHFATAGKEATDDAQIEADIVPVATRVAGLVVKLSVQDNQHVKKGDLILALDDADYAAREKQAEAEVETAAAQAAAADAQAQVSAAGARGGFTSARAQVSGSGAALETARAAVSSAEAEARRAEQELTRMKELRQSNVVAQERLDEAQATNDKAQAALQQARAGLETAQSRIGEARGRLDQSAPVNAAIAAAQANARLAHARQKSAEAMLTLAKNQLAYSKVYAQEDGQITRLTAREGQLVQPGQPLASLVPDRTYLVANFKETQITDMKPGQAVDIAIDSYPGADLHGKVESIAGGTGARFSLLPPDNASGNFVKVVQRVPVRIAWVNPPANLPLLPGLSADVTVHVK